MTADEKQPANPLAEAWSKLLEQWTTVTGRPESRKITPPPEPWERKPMERKKQSNR